MESNRAGHGTCARGVSHVVQITASLWRNIRHRSQVERDLHDEVQATLHLLTEEKIAAGATPTAARRAAAIELGNTESIKEQVRDVRAGARIDTTIGDVRYAARVLARNPLFTMTAALSLAIGIGATTAVVTIANGLLLRSAVGVADPGRVVDVVVSESDDPGVTAVSYPDYLELRRLATTLDGVYAYELELVAASLRVADEGAERVFATNATTNFFSVLGVGVAAGRPSPRQTTSSLAPHQSPSSVITSGSIGSPATAGSSGRPCD